MVYAKTSTNWVPAKVTAVTTPGSATSTIGIKLYDGTTRAAVVRQTAKAQANVWNHIVNGYI